MSSNPPAVPQPLGTSNVRRRLIPSVSGAVAVLLGVFVGTGGFTFYYANGSSITSLQKTRWDFTPRKKPLEFWQKPSTSRGKARLSY